MPRKFDSFAPESSAKVPTPPPPTPVQATPLTPYTDAAVFNSTFAWENNPGLPTHILDLIGTDVRDKPVLPYGPNVDGTVTWQMDAGVQQDTSDGIITYTFATWNHGVGVSNSPKFGQGQGFSPFTPEQQDAARIAIANWDDLVSATFVEVPSGRGASVFGQNSADIVLSNTFTGPAQAEAYYPGLVPYYGKKYERVEGSLWVADPEYNSSNLQLEPGQYGLLTLNHELGHTLGLTHPGTYNFGDDNDGDGQPDPINYTGDAQYFQDSMQFTIMSYFDSYETGAQPIDWNVLRFVYASTPMVDDVYVIQQKYGADETTRTGDTTYGFNATADVTNEAMSFHTGEMATIFTIWDAGGNDTIDLSGYYTNSVIDLREGGFSSAGGWGAYDPNIVSIDPAALGQADTRALLDIINANNAAAGFGPRELSPDTLAGQKLGYDYYYRLYFEGGVQDYDQNYKGLVDKDGNPIYINDGESWREITGTGSRFLMEQNIGIAYGAIVENAIGGHGDDRINGNQVDNTFTGGAGADTFIFANYAGSIPDPTTSTGYKLVESDTSIDTITDFQTGVDKIDLSFWEGLDASRVQFTSASDTLKVDTNLDGDFTDAGDVTIIVHGTDVAAGDYIFA